MNHPRVLVFRDALADLIESIEATVRTPGAGTDEPADAAGKLQARLSTAGRLAPGKFSGARSDAPAYIDDISLTDCLLAVLRTPGLIARVSLAGSFTPPLPDRRHLAHRAHQAVATALAHHADPWNRGIKPFQDPGQPLRNEAAIRQ